MARKRHSDENIFKLLREIEVKLSNGSDVQSDCRGAGISDATYYNWRKRCRTGWQGSASNPSGSIPGHRGRTDITNASTARCAARCSTPSGSPRRRRPRSSSTSGSDCTITSVRIRLSTCDRQCRRTLSGMAQNLGSDNLRSIFSDTA